MMPDSKHIRFELSGNTGIITLDNPPRNFLEQPDFMDVSLLAEWADHPQVNGLIIRGAGRHFSAGADLENLFELAADRDFLFESMQAGKKLLSAIEDLEIPVLAAIGGICFGGGLEIALACHMRVCSSSSLFAFPEVNYNLLPGLGGTARLAGITGESAALKILLAGDTINADEAYRLRLVDDRVPQNELSDFSMNLMERMVGGKNKKVVRYIMKAWHNSRKLTASDALLAETELFCELATDELERRKNPDVS